MSYREFESTDEVNEWAQKYFGDFLNNPDEPIYDKVYEYTGNTYIPINRLLRALPSWPAEECKNGLSEVYREFYDDGMELYEYLGRFKVPENVIVYRFLSHEGVKELFGRWFPRKGRRGREKAFMSTSLLLSAAKEFAKSKRGVMLRIRVPAGTPGLYVSQDQYKGNLLRECELLLPPGIQLQVVKMGVFRLECEMSEIT